MPWMPGVIRKEIKRHRTRIKKHRGLVQHVAVSKGASLFNYFNQSGNPTSHWYVREDGDVEQYVDTIYRAPCQLDGNAELLSIETWGGFTGDLNKPWNAAMAQSLAEIWYWASETHDFPLRLMTDSRPTQLGIGWHQQGVDPYRVDGGQKWSSSFGKECPGKGKIAQMPSILVISKKLALPQGDSMSAQDVDRLIKHIDQKFAIFGPGGTESNRWAQIIEEGREQTLRVLSAQQALLDKMAADDAVDTGRYEQEINESRGQYDRLANMFAEQKTQIKELTDKVEDLEAEEPPKA